VARDVVIVGGGGPNVLVTLDVVGRLTLVTLHVVGRLTLVTLHVVGRLALVTSNVFVAWLALVTRHVLVDLVLGHLELLCWPRSR
jgi:hypothetical protein